MSGRSRGVDNSPSWMSNRPSESHSRGAPPMHQQQPRGPPRYDNRRRYDDDDDRRRGPPMRGRGYRGGPPRGHRRPHVEGIVFQSYEEERRWVEDRRTKRKKRKSKFDVLPTPEQAAFDAAYQSMANPAATDFSGVPVSQLANVNQQTRHARRLYVGNLPTNITEGIIHDRFYEAIQKTAVQSLSGDPILSTYINPERRFCFLEFKTVEMATACLQLDGLELQEGWPCKVKRPNDYNAMTAPKHAVCNILDVSRLGIVASTVPDGPNKIFIGGLHYYLTEPQVMELLSAFGKIKAFHLVKEASEGNLSKGYAFCEYIDPSVTQIAVDGLNGMDIGNDKTLTARYANERGALGGLAETGALLPGAAAATPTAAMVLPTQPPPNRTIVAGYDVEYLVDASMGSCPMPTTIQYRDAMGMPLTQIVSVRGKTDETSSNSGRPTRVIRLQNLVTEEDLQEDAYADFQGEIREECEKYGVIEDLKVPREDGRGLVFLSYATLPQAQEAQRQLNERRFGSSVISATFYDETKFAKGQYE